MKLKRLGLCFCDARERNAWGAPAWVSAAAPASPGVAMLVPDWVAVLGSRPSSKSVSESAWQEVSRECM